MPRHPDRHLRLAGATNFRDLGGYGTESGLPLRWRRLFRSDHLGALTADDRALLARLAVGAAFDFRGLAERAATPYDLPGLVQHSLAIEPSVTQRMDVLAAGGRALTGPQAAALMQDLYRRLVRHQAPRFAQLFRHIIAAEVPVVFHCTAGKDRTGVAAALLLLALGVPRDTVMADFLLTNDHYRPPHVVEAAAAGAAATATFSATGLRLEPEALQALWGVRPSYLEAALQVLDEEFGGAHDYLRGPMAINETDLAALKSRYLQSD